MNRAKLVLTVTDLHELLRLRSAITITGLTASLDPPSLQVHLVSDEFAPVPPDDESHIVRLHRCQRSGAGSRAPA